MTAIFDRLINPRWPNPTDGPTARARRVAGMYRAALNTAAPAMAVECDTTVRQFGETWMLDREEYVDPDREVTTAEAAELVHVHPDTIRKWACMNDPHEPENPLLPRFKKRGRERTYLAGKVLEAAATLRRAEAERTRRLP